MLNPFQTNLINRFVFIDCENVNAKETFDFVKEHNFLNLQTQIVCLIGADKNQNNWYNDFKKNLTNLAVNVTPIRVSKSGDQFLDKVLLTYVGFAIGQNPLAEIYIFAKDKCYGGIVEHFKTIGVNIIYKNLASEKAECEVQENTTSTEKKSEKKKKTWTVDAVISNILKKKEKKEKSFPSLQNLENHIKQKYSFSNSDIEKVIQKLQTDKKIEINGEKITWNYTEKKSITKKNLPQTKSEFSSEKARKEIKEIPLSERPKTIGELKECLKQNYNCQNIDNSIKGLLSSLKSKKMITNSSKQSNITDDVKITWKN